MSTLRGRMPVLFLGHGNPMNAIEDNAFHRSWTALGRTLPRPEAVLCISAHWETRGVFLTGSESPETIHDFHGFPRALFDLQYPAPGHPGLARRTAERLGVVSARLDGERGLDHGAWSVLVAMYPEADIPVVQLSLDTSQPAAFHYAMGRQLASLRDEGVLIVGSGNVVHNLRLFRFGDPKPLDWAVRVDEKVKRRLVAREHQALIDYHGLDEDARLAVPTPEHYLPLLYAVALRGEEEPLEVFNSTVLGSISMTSILIGEVA